MAARNENPNARFRYPAFSPVRDEIRLLSLDSTNHLGDVFCSLSNTPLDNPNLKFLALSYTWGTAEAANYIFVNGQKVWVKPNLYDFLTMVAASNLMGCSIFIDAICIDQGNDTEKAEQIQHMREIYSRATSVIAWLGIPNSSNEQEPDVEDVIKRDFWSRLWIVQEVMLARNLTIQYGQFAFAPEELFDPDEAQINSDAFEFTRRYAAGTSMMNEMGLGGVAGSFMDRYGSMGENGQEREELYHATRACRILAQRHERQIGHGNDEAPPLHQAMMTFGSHASTDRRDKIFGLLGLARSSIKADYSMSMMELYLRVLIEGMYEIAAEHRGQINDTSEVSLGEDYVRRTSQYHSACMMALSVPNYPCVSLVTTRAMQHCGVISLSSGLYSGYHHTIVNACDNDSVMPIIKGKQPMADLFRAGFVSVAGRLAAAAGSAQLQSNRRNGTVFGLPGDRDVRTFDEWLSLVDRVADEYDEINSAKRPLPRDLVGPGSEWRRQHSA